MGDVLSAMPPLEEPDEHFFALLAYLESEESLPVSSLLCGLGHYLGIIPIIFRIQ